MFDNGHREDAFLACRYQNRELMQYIYMRRHSVNGFGTGSILQSTKTHHIAYFWRKAQLQQTNMDGASGDTRGSISLIDLICTSLIESSK